MVKRSAAAVLAAMILGGCVSQPEIAPQRGCISAEKLNSYSYDHLSKVAALVRADQKNIESFEGFINTMKGTVDDYAQMVKSSIYISNVVRFLPVPYAGEVSNSAKVLSKTVLNLGGAASALNRYKKSSESFLAGFDRLDPAGVQAADIAKLAAYADTKVLADAEDLRQALSAISESTAVMAATTQSIANALETTGGYVNQAKTLVGLSPDQEDETKVAQSRHSINARMIQLNQKIASLENSAYKHRNNIAKVRIYSELAMEAEKMGK